MFICYALQASNLECVLISDTYHRSVEYIQCLAGGVPILSHLWVVESSRQGQLQPKEAHFLPAGYDEITHTLSSDKYGLDRKQKSRGFHIIFLQKCLQEKFHLVSRRKDLLWFESAGQDQEPAGSHPQGGPCRDRRAEPQHVHHTHQ